MTNHLSIQMRSGGSVRTTLDFHAGGYTLLDAYYPNTSESEQATDKFDLWIQGATEAELESRLQAVELALDFAAAHPKGPDGVWLLYSPNEATMTPWQSRISGGAVLLNRQIGLTWRENRAKVEVVVERAPWFETQNPVTLGTANLVNHQDADPGHIFYIDLAEGIVTGGLPTPAIIEFKNTTNNVRRIDNLYVGHFAESKPFLAPAAGTLILEGSGTADASCSGGAYAALPWVGVGENILTGWSLASDLLAQRYYKLVARFQAGFAYTDLWLKATLRFTGFSLPIMAETRWTQMSASKELQVLGTLQIPPYIYGKYNYINNVVIDLYEKRAGGDGTINLDYIALLPQDSWRHYGANSINTVGLDYNHTLIDNPVEESLVDATVIPTYLVSHMVRGGEPVMLRPGVRNLLYFLHDVDNGTAPIARTATVTVKYHPRRRTL